MKELFRLYDKIETISYSDDRICSSKLVAIHLFLEEIGLTSLVMMLLYSNRVREYNI